MDSIALKNMARRPSKSFFIVLGIMLAVGAIVTMYTAVNSMHMEFADRFDEIGANIMVVPKTQEFTLSYGGVSIRGSSDLTYLVNDDVVRINTIPNSDNIATVAPKLLAPLDVMGRKLVVVGVDFPQELALKPWWDYQGNTPRGVMDVLLGADTARILGLAPGDPLVIAGEEFRVTGVLHPQGSEEDGLIFMQLLAVQRLAGLEDKLSLIEVAAYCTTCPIEEIVADINDAIHYAQATALGEAVQARAQVVDSFTNFTYAVAAVVFFIGSMLVLVTMIGSVKERTREIGIFRALGFRQSSIMEIFLTEALVLGVIGGILGYGAGVLAARILAPVIAGIEVAVEPNPILGGSTIILAIALSLLASAYPAVKAAKLDPVEAMRHI
ncbi:MAG: FtsX-like permease family protein [Bacillota bacterium]